MESDWTLHGLVLLHEIGAGLTQHYQHSQGCLVGHGFLPPFVYRLVRRDDGHFGHSSIRRCLAGYDPTIPRRISTVLSTTYATANHFRWYPSWLCQLSSADEEY